MELKQLIDEWEAFIHDERNQMTLLRPEEFITICCIFIALVMCCFCNRHRNYYILHFNGSDINQHDKGGAGCIIRNKEGEFVTAGAYNLKYLNLYPKQFNVAIAGAVALRNGLKLAKQKDVKLHLIKGKNKEVIDRVRGQHKRSSPGQENESLSKLIKEIRKALCEQSIDPETQVKVIGEEEANEAAHALAYYGSKDLGFANEEIYLRKDDLPTEVAKSLQHDKKFKRANNFRM